MFDFLRSLWNHPYAQTFLAFSTIIGLLLTIYACVISRRKKEITYAVAGYKLIEHGKNSIDKLDIQYEGKPIYSLTISRFAIWNRGKLPITMSDIAPSAPLAIKISNDAEILSASIIKVSEEANEIMFDVQDNKLIFRFNHIDSRQGVIVQVLHTGDKESIGFDGKIIGGKQISSHRKIGVLGKFFRRIRRKIGSYNSKKLFFSMMLMLILSCLVQMSTMTMQVIKDFHISRMSLMFFIIILFLIPMYILIFFDILKIGFHYDIPRHLANFDDFSDLL